MPKMDKLKGRMPKPKREVPEEDMELMIGELEDEEMMEEEGGAMPLLEDISDEELLAEIKARGLLAELDDDEAEAEEEY